MFEFFKGFIGSLELKLIDNFSDKVSKFINNLFLECKNKKDNTTEIEASSGNYTKQASSGNHTQQASSGDGTQQASSGYGTQQASSGYGTQQASSGDYTKQASSGDGTQQASSGDCTKQASSGYGTQQASSGNHTQQASSGYGTQQASSGDFTKQASSGNHTQQASSGDFTKQASSGDFTKHEVTGKNSIAFACGYKSIIKGIKGTWIALAEYKKDGNGNIVPIFAKTAQIGNKDYKDNRKRILKANTYYILWKKEFYEVKEYDEILTIVLSKKKRENIEIIKAINIDDILDDEIEEIYIAKENDLTAHGSTIREAIEDLTFKKMQNTDVTDIIKEIKRTGKVNRNQYRIITGACSYGTNKFCKEHNIQDLEEIEIDELRKILINDYGAEKFWNLIDGGVE